MSAGEQLLSDLRAIAIDLAAIDRMTVELAAQEIENLRKRVAEMESGDGHIMGRRVI